MDSKSIAIHFFLFSRRKKNLPFSGLTFFASKLN